MDTGGAIPPALPPVLALICAVVAGLTSFGDAIMFHVLWAVCGAVGWLAQGRRETLTKAVLYITVMPLANLPIQLWVSRAMLWRCLPYGAVMAVTGLCMVPVGARLLFFGDLTGLKMGVGSFFLLFSFARLTSWVAAWGRARVAAQGRSYPPRGDDGGSGSDKSGDGRDTAALSLQDSVAAASVSSPSGAHTLLVLPVDSPTHATNAAAWDVDEERHVGRGDGGHVDDKHAAAAVTDDVGQGAMAMPEPSSPPPSPACDTPTSDPSLAGAMTCSVCGRRLTVHRISTAFSIRGSLALLFATGTMSGLLGGLFGTGGPPQMIAFSLLRIDKDAIRGVSTVYGLLELGMRVAMFTTSEGSVFDGGEWGVYLCIVLASWTGFTLGTWVRRWCNTDAIVALLLVLVFASSSILLGALDDTRIAILFAALACVWFALLAALAMRPRWVDRGLHTLWSGMGQLVAPCKHAVPDSVSCGRAGFCRTARVLPTTHTDERGRAWTGRRVMGDNGVDASLVGEAPSCHSPETVDGRA